MKSSMYLLLVGTTSGSLLPSSCSHQPSSSSSWEDHLQARHRLPPTVGHQHRRSLTSSLRELVQLIDRRKNRFTRDELQTTYSYQDEAFATLSYEWVVPRGALVANGEWESMVSSAYSTFQRLALALEVARVDMEHHGDARPRTVSLWASLDRRVRRVLELVHSELRAGGREEQGVVAREEVPQWLRCVQHSVGRDTRDFIILRHVLQASNFFSQQFSDDTI